MIERQREISDGPLDTMGEGAYPYSDMITFWTVFIHIERALLPHLVPP